MKTRIKYEVRGDGTVYYIPQQKVLKIWLPWSAQDAWVQKFEDEDEAHEFLDEKIKKYMKKKRVDKGIV